MSSAESSRLAAAMFASTCTGSTGSSRSDTVMAVITAVHALVYSDDEAATRAFLRDVLELPNVDVHDGWLIFRTGPSELGVHPASDASVDSGAVARTRHELTFLCDDLARTVAELSAKGAHFVGEPNEQRWGVTIMMTVPGAGEVMLYEPRHPVAYDL
jgi:catechol 2,3-dioxygenase-like lactoylglutathione lyase family enzyme